MAYSIKIMNAKQVQKNFAEMSRRLANPQSAMDSIAGYVYSDVMEHFRKEEGDNHVKWPKWRRKVTQTGLGSFSGVKYTAMKTYSVRPTKRGGMMLLQDTGLLRNSIQHRGFRSGAAVWVYTRYGKYHITGTERNGKPCMPKRNFFWISKEVREKIKAKMGDFVVREVAGKK